jgi:alkanesulfonate monooxygenase SsuD/methylene tetrahydromethanopterin reductase-like flavin-dependent oxidoreductase (luciferase family)
VSVPLSILDLVSISEGSNARQAIAASVTSAQLADRRGYTRLWFAEHHNTSGTPRRRRSGSVWVPAA